MNNPPAKWKFALAALPPLLILLALPLKPLLISALGTEVTLAVRPVDPRDLFRGDYVALSFEIESVPVALFQPERRGTPEQAAKRRSEWYVTLAPGPEGLWIPERVTPKLKREPALKGRVKYLGQTIGGPQKAEMDYGTNMRRYYVRENTGRALEQAAQNGTLRAKVRIWHGEAVIQSVQIVVPKSNEDKK